MVRRPAAVLIAAALVAFEGWSHLAPALGQVRTPIAVAIIAGISLPLAGAVALSALSLRNADGVWLLAIAAGALIVAVIATRADLRAEASTAKALLAGVAGVAAARVFQHRIEAILIALGIIAVDIWSVFAGPTRTLIEEQPETLALLSVALPAPGLQEAAAIGMPDLLFLALFTAVAAPLGLRERATALAMLASLSVTSVASWALERPLPALPLLSLAFLLANADRLAARR